MLQFSSPIVGILTLAVALSFALNDPCDGVLILEIVLVSALLGFWQERGAARVIEALLEAVEQRTRVLRDGHSCSSASALKWAELHVAK